MRKTMSLLLTLAMIATLSACAATESGSEPIAAPTQTEQEEVINVQTEAAEIETDSINPEDFPIVGMWEPSKETGTHLRIQGDGTLTHEAILTNTITSTVNGVSTTHTSQRLATVPGVWSLQDGMFILNNKATFELVYDGTDYKLVSATTTYTRIGEVDYELAIDSENTDAPTETTPYTIGEQIIAEGIELSFSESGFSDDIRYTSKSSGISITSGPNPEEDKQFFYLKGTLKNTGKQTVRPAIGGNAVLDEYEYAIRVDITNEDGTPCSSIEPLDSVIIQIYAHIPVELVSTFEAGELIFGFNDNFETVDITNCDYLYSVQAIQ